MRVIVTTIELDTGSIIREDEINWTNQKTKFWLNQHLHWAFNNGCGIQMRNINDKEPIL